MRRLLVLGLLFGGMQLILPLGAEGHGSQTLLTFGFLILAAYTVGELAAAVGLPHIVGYLAAGVLFGPSALGVVTAGGIERLTVVSNLAIALIAFLAGAELQWADLRERWGELLRIVAAEQGMAFLVLAVLFYALSGLMPFLADAAPATVLAAALLFAAVAIVHSPAVTLALLSESGARGPVARTTLGVVLVVDVTVVLLFSAALAVARALAPPVGDVAVPSAGAIVWEIAGAVLVGAALGAAVALYLRFVGRELMLFAVLVAFFGIEIARFAHVELLLTLLVAGFVAENTSRHGDALRHAIERSAAPVFVVFFALSGARIDVAAVAPLLPLVVPMALVRGAAIWGGVRAGTAWARSEPAVRRYAWMGLVSQAGVAIGLAAIVAEAYGALGASLRDLLLALVAVNETVGPILFRRALRRSGEARDVAVEAGAAAAVRQPG